MNEFKVGKTKMKMILIWADFFEIATSHVIIFVNS